MYDRKVATTFFFSTSGGRTANVQDAWRGGVPTPYLVSVADPYDGASPHHTWGPSRSPPPSQKTFRVPGRLVDARVAVNPSQRVSTVTFVNQRGDEIVVSGSGRSHSAEPSVHLVPLRRPSLARPTKPVDYGTTARLTGQARQRLGHARAACRRCLGARGETQAGSRRDGHRRRQAARHHRLPADVGDVQQHSVRVTVAPRVRLHQVTQQTALTGIVRPIMVGARWRSSGSAARRGAWSRARCSTTAASSRRVCNSSPAPTARASSPAAGSCRASRRSRGPPGEARTRCGSPPALTLAGPARGRPVRRRRVGRRVSRTGR